MVWQLPAMESEEIFLQREYWQAVLLWKQFHVDLDLYGALKINHKWKVENGVPFCGGRVGGFGAGGKMAGAIPASPLPGLAAH